MTDKLFQISFLQPLEKIRWKIPRTLSHLHQCVAAQNKESSTEELAGFAGTMPTMEQHTASIFTCKVPPIQASAVSHSNSRYQ